MGVDSVGSVVVFFFSYFPSSLKDGTLNSLFFFFFAALLHFFASWLWLHVYLQ